MFKFDEMRDYLLKKSYDLYVGKKGAAKTC